MVNEAIINIFQAAGENIPEEGALTKLSVFIEELDVWNRRFKITGLKTNVAMVEYGIFPGYKLVKHFGSGENVVDIGSGGGFPGLVIAALRDDISLTLVESSRKKAAFLKTASFKMKAGNVRVISQRAENLKQDLMFDSAVSMAVFKPQKWLNVGRKFVRSGGKLFLLHSGNINYCNRVEGLEMIFTEEFFLPFSGKKRGITVFRVKSNQS